MVEKAGAHNGDTYVEIGTIVQGSEIDRDPSCRWIMVVCRDSTGVKGCGEQRWARYNGKVRSASSNRLCGPCNTKKMSNFRYGWAWLRGK